MTGKAFINGKIYTVNQDQPLADTVVTSGNKIHFVGKKEDARQLIHATTEIIDLDGKLMLPGFIDNHTHFTPDFRSTSLKAWQKPAYNSDSAVID